MSVRNLHFLFEPTAIAVVGASDTPRSVGAVVMRNLLDGGFAGPIMPVHPKYRAVAGVLAYPSVDLLPIAPDLAILCTPPDTLPRLIDQLGRKGCRIAIVVSADAEWAGCRQAAQRHNMRLLGAGSLGVLVPKSRLNISFSHIPAEPGRIAFVSQSGALCTAVLDWARPRGIGFSAFLSLGDCMDVDFADALDHLANDEATRAILLYIEDIRERRAFMPALRAAARNKPVVLVKAGRAADDPSPSQAAFLAEALTRPDEAFEAAIGRAGALGVTDLDELFAAVETLARTRPPRGDRLAIVSNGGGTAMMAVDELLRGNGTLAPLSEECIRKLQVFLPKSAKVGNPVDLAVDSDGKRTADAIRVLIEAPDIDAVLVIHAPNAMTDGIEVARAVVDTQKRHGGHVLTCWVGEAAARPARRLFAEAGLPTYDTPGQAVRGFRHLLAFQSHQEMLLQTPPSHLLDFQPDAASARAIVARSLAAGGGLLLESEAKTMLAAYGIAAQPSHHVADSEAAASKAVEIGLPVALTVASPDIPRKWDVGGVALNLETPDAVRAACAGILHRTATKRPDARIEGFTIQSMALRPHARQLMIGIACDPLFGPLIVFGEGGRAVEIVRDHTLALPPLNLPLARAMIERTRIVRLLAAHGARAAADIEALAVALVRLSQMLVDNPEIVACDVNPLFCDDQGVLAVDARMRIEPVTPGDRRHFAVLPYPGHLEEPTVLHDGTEILIRPIRPEDEPAHADLIGHMTPQDLRYRFHGHIRTLAHHQLARLTQIDYDREMAFIATHTGKDGQPETLGVVRTVTDPDNHRAELAILVRSNLKGTGLGRKLLETMVDFTRNRGTHEMVIQVLAENAAMLKLAAKMGFALKPAEEDPDIVEGILICD
ncbi:MAG: bifunctional acetate--CoA ligase family protein/GNAT family N-acetyltransferase [Alphaproteobacteria bacterium]|nr:bifunctional acetate--CoA ligase family protein/GNAT family N-acetyltransferase [Alphaproteobacteria bacterium]